MGSSVTLFDGVSLTSLRKIYHPKGDVYHALKNCEESFSVFGEAYFTNINAGDIKGWKKHTKMIMNLIVPHGEVGFYFFRDNKSAFIQAGQSNYVRITVEPNIWMAFEGIGHQSNLILNIASLPHDPLEAENAVLEAFPLSKGIPRI